MGMDAMGMDPRLLYKAVWKRPRLHNACSQLPSPRAISSITNSITHPHERNVHHMYQEEGPDDFGQGICHNNHVRSIAVPEKQKVMTVISD